MSRLIVNDELVLYGDVGDLWGDGSGFTGREVIEALAVFGDKDVHVRLNSGGGLAWEGLAIYNALAAHSGKVTVSVDAIAASAASVIAMAGAEIVMRRGATMMIHDPSAVTIGPAEAHIKSAAVLNRLGDQIADVYAARSGKDVAELRELMLAETWMSGTEALALGLATAADQDGEEEEEEDDDPKKKETEETAVASFDYSIYAHAPDFVSRHHRPLPSNSQKGPLMTVQTKAVDQPTAKVEKVENSKAPDRTREILARCTTAKLSLAQANEIVAQADGSLDKARDLIIDALAAAEPQANGQVLPNATITADARDRQKTGMEKALLARAGMDGGERNEFAGLTLRELAREVLNSSGIRTPFRDPMEMVKAAFQPTMAAGQHSTSDFVEVLANVANKSMLKGYEDAEETFERWTARGTLTDFKIHKRVDLGLFPSLSEVPEGAEYHYATMSDRAATIQLATYGRMFSITRQAIINDDLSVFTRIPNRMGRAARRTIGNLVYALLTANPTMTDGVALFHASHSNLAGSGGAPTVATLDTARAAMALQQDPDGHADGGLNIRPRFFLVPVELEGSARTLMASEFDPSKTQRTPNHVRGLAEVISEARLSANSTTAWYLAADPSAVDTIEVAYLNGVNTPLLEQRDGWNVDGVEFKVRLDAGVQAFDHRGLYKNAGA